MVLGSETVGICVDCGVGSEYRRSGGHVMIHKGKFSNPDEVRRERPYSVVADGRTWLCEEFRPFEGGVSLLNAVNWGDVLDAVPDDPMMVDVYAHVTIGGQWFGYEGHKV